MKLYHATTKTNSKDIKESGFSKIPSFPHPLVYSGNPKVSKKPGSLGYGLYGFEDRSLAEDFQMKIKGETDIIEFEINTASENTWLDLTNKNDLINYNAFKRKLSSMQVYRDHEEAFKNSKKQSSFEGAMIEYYIKSTLNKELGIKVTCVKAFTVTQTNYSQGSHVANGIEYLIKCNDIIKQDSESEGVE